MISADPREDRLLKATAAIMVTLMACLTLLRTCSAINPSGTGGVCAAMEAFRLKAIAVLGEPDPRGGCPR